LEKFIHNFNFNFINFFERENVVMVGPFQQTLPKFYTGDIISSNSTVMGECELILKSKQVNLL
jgi:hypothetical protein